MKRTDYDGYRIQSSGMCHVLDIKFWGDKFSISFFLGKCSIIIDGGTQNGGLDCSSEDSSTEYDVV